ncbi:MAG: restriction endonuclease subunit S [Nonlabens sp.]|uniref:restriction endonuclease subunit S n=1 Tax=Nonlabens sp. TaxID=1888209 RepID=UPI00321A4B43
MSWEEHKLKDVATFINGKAYKAAELLENGKYRVLRVGNLFTSNSWYYSDLELNPDKYCSNGDLIYAWSATFGPRIWKEEKVIYHYHIWKVEPKTNLIDKMFLFYLLDWDSENIKSTFGTGATMIHVSKSSIETRDILLPPLQTQKRIADILSAYDNLIENNLKRIKLLEQAAQNIYKEWFVNLRFPGHENTPINEETGLPVGWEEKALGEFTEIKKGKNITKSTIKEGNVPVVAGGLKPAYYHNTSNTSNPVITVSASGANAGYVNMYLEDIWASDCSYIDSKLSDSVFFIHNLLSNQQELIFGMQRGAAQPHVYTKDLKRAEFVIPDKGLIQKFEEQVSAQYEMKRVLLNQNQKLKAARDILLPRLMNRTIEV